MYANESNAELTEGQLVHAEVRTGKYIGEIVQFNGPRAVVKVLAVVKHPDQGDLHSSFNPDAAMFHERRALSYTEKTTVLKRDLKAYNGSVPDYKQSLLQAAEAEIIALGKLERWAAQSLEILQELKKDYEK